MKLDSGQAKVLAYSKVYRVSLEHTPFTLSVFGDFILGAGEGRGLYIIHSNLKYQQSLKRTSPSQLDWLQSLKQFFMNVSYHILVASLTLMTLFRTESSEFD